METHFRVKGSHALKNVHAAGVQSPKRVQGKEKSKTHRPSDEGMFTYFIPASLLVKLRYLLFIFMQGGLQQAEGVDQS